MYTIFTVGRASITQEYLVIKGTESVGILGSPQALLNLIEISLWCMASDLNTLDKYYKLSDPYEISSKEELIAYIKMLRIL